MMFSPFVVFSVIFLQLSFVFLHAKHLYDDALYCHSIRRPATFSFALSRSCHVLDLAPKHAWAVALYVMGGRQRLLDDAYIPKRAQELSSLRHGVWDSQG